MNKIKYLKVVSEIIQSWMSLLTMRKHNELKIQMVYEVLDEPFEDSLELLELKKLFWERVYFSEIENEEEQKQVIDLLNKINVNWIFFRTNFENIMKHTEEQEQNQEVSFDDKLTLTMEFIQNTANQVSEWEIDTMKGYIALKKIEKTLKKYLKPVWELARDVFWNYDKNDLPYGGKWTLQLKTTIDYKSNPIYSEEMLKLKEFEAVLKNAVEQNKKGNVVCDIEWNAIDVPEYKMSETLVIKWI